MNRHELNRETHNMSQKTTIGRRSALTLGAAAAASAVAPRRARALPFGVWLALARATPLAAQDDAQQSLQAN